MAGATRDVDNDDDGERRGKRTQEMVDSSWAIVSFFFSFIFFSILTFFLATEYDNQDIDYDYNNEDMSDMTVPQEMQNDDDDTTGGRTAGGSRCVQTRLEP